MLKAIKLKNLLSFGGITEITFNKGLNVLIGANGSGKSNLIEVISLLQAMPRDNKLSKVISDGGDIGEWLWKGEEISFSGIETLVENPKDQPPLRHTLEFIATGYHLEIINESIAKTNPPSNISKSVFHYKYDGQQASVNSQFHDGKTLHNIETRQSILAQRQDPEAYPEMDYLGDYYKKIRLYREWQFGRDALVRKPQRTGLANDFLEEDISNLALVLNRLSENREVKRRLLDELKLFYESIEDFGCRIINDRYVEIFFQESSFNTSVPATRLSDGTLRYLSLLAILLHPNPPPLICIEEPELGLHPDILPTLIDLLKEAAQKTQIIITTHSADLVDALSNMPEAVLVFDKHEGSTTVTRLNKEDLADWLEDYSLGQLWSRGHIGGNRW
jgi:predicted ATPase